MNVQNNLENKIAMVTGRWMKVYNHKWNITGQKKELKPLAEDNEQNY